MKEVIVTDCTPQEVMDIVRNMREQGLVQGKDFDFAYSHANYDSINFIKDKPSQVIFTFYDEKWATMFVLKWAELK